MRTSATSTTWKRLRWVALGIACFTPAACGPSAEPPAEPRRPAASQPPIRVLVVDDAPLAKAVELEWKSRAEVRIEVRSAELQEIAEAKRLAADAVIYPSGLLGDLAERKLIIPIPNETFNHAQPARSELFELARSDGAEAEEEENKDQLARSDIFEVERLHEPAWGESIFAVPFGSPQLTLYYRADIFEHLDLKPPESWAQYQEVVSQVSRRQSLGDLAPPGDAPWRGAVEPLGPGWACQVLLARAAAYARHRSQYSTLFNFNTMAPLIDGPPFVRALEELIAAAAAAGPQGTRELITYGPRDAERDFLAGRCAMAMSWPTRAASADEAADLSAASGGRFSTAFAELPGSPDVYNFRDKRWERRMEEESGRIPLLAVAGRLGSVTKESRQPRRALELLIWLSGIDLSDDVAPHSTATTLYRASHLSSPGRWVREGMSPEAASQYAQLVSQVQSRSSWLFAVRIPGRKEYLGVLDDAVHQALAGDKSPAQALQDAAQRWRSITEQRGQEKQLQAYLRSLELEP